MSDSPGMGLALTDFPDVLGGLLVEVDIDYY
jgi:hypothetical protein